MGEVSYDCEASFDQIHLAQCNIYTLHQNIHKNLLHACTTCIEWRKHYMKSHLGVSLKTYQQQQDQPHIGDENQGKGDVPSLYRQKSSILHTDQAWIETWIYLESYTGDWSRWYTSMCKWHSWTHVGREWGEDPIDKVMEKLKMSAQLWSKLSDITDSSIAMHEYNWKILAWELLNSEFHLVWLMNK